MALSRLRSPVIYRAPSLLRARLLSSAVYSPSSSSRLLNSVTDVESCTRPIPLSGGHEVHGSVFKRKINCGMRFFSSTDSPEHAIIGMPALSPTMMQGNIAKWWKKEGDKINVGDVLCEIETDKATLEFESQEEGFLAKILAPEGSKDIPVGQPIAITVEDQNDIQRVPAVAGIGPEDADKTSQQNVADRERLHETPSEKIDTSDLPPHIVLEMPALSPTMSQGNIVKWKKQEGDKINVGEVLCEIETDKATVEFESLEECFLAKILVAEGSKDVAVGQPIAVTVEDANDVESVKTSLNVKVVPQKENPVHHDTTGTKEVDTHKTGFNRISPSAKLLLIEHGLDASSMKASGPRGTLLKGDVLAAIKSGKGSAKVSSSKETKAPSLQTKPQTSASLSSGLPQDDAFEDFPNSQIRKVIAARLLESKQSIPHIYLSSDVTLDPLLSFRKELKEKFDIKVSVNDIVIKVVAMALKNVPQANAYWDSNNDAAVLCDAVDISIAVATDKGLMTPIIRNADQKSISAISLEIKELAARARAGKLKPNEFQGGTFSVSNLGMYPVDHFCAIINPPQAGILAVGRGNQVVVPVLGSDGVEKAGVLTKMTLTLSADHRIFDGYVGGTFLTALHSNFSDIHTLLL